MAIRATYKGDGTEYLLGVPARNLDEDDYLALDSEQRKAVRESSIYAYKTDKEMSAASTAAPVESPSPKAESAVTPTATTRGEGATNADTRKNGG
ncbi:MAG TPA: hypothetical protein VNM48_16520 [Chloroflexota bacterium]|nr:hypothetical protein [Chloroflexota bacterium]